MKKRPIKTHPMWNPNEPAYADVGDVVGKAFAAGLRPDPVEEPAAADLPPELLEALVRENHGAVMRELKRMQDEPGYVSEWEPKKEMFHAPLLCYCKNN